MEEAERSRSLPRLGLVATDEVRIAGLRAVLTDEDGKDQGVNIRVKSKELTQLIQVNK